MRNLYLRFFVSFWSAMLLVLAVTVAITIWMAIQRREGELDRQDLLAREASSVLASDGVPGLRDWLLVQLPQLRPDRIYVLDAHGQDLLGRPVPAYLQARVGRGPFPDQPREDREARLLSQLISPNDETFALSLSTQRIGPWGIFGGPETPLIAGIVTLLVSAVVCYLLSRFLSAPIQQLRSATHSIAAGNLGVQVASSVGKRRDELAMLAIDFDAMAARLRTLIESQQQLLRDVSHELRSPLARLQMALGLARRPHANLDNELDRIEQEAQRLDELIGEILSLCRLDEPGRVLQQEPVALEELLEILCENARFEADPRDVRVHLQLEPGLTVSGDRELLYRAIENVLRNAVRFSPDGGLVSVHAVRAARGGAEIRIRDQGPGVPAALLERIFEPFYRVAAARDRDSGGYGIGLAITARVVKLHGGTVHAANADGTGGLIVTLQMPAKPLPPG